MLHRTRVRLLSLPHGGQVILDGGYAGNADTTRTTAAHEAGSHQLRQRATAAMTAQRHRRRRTRGGVGKCNGGVEVRLQYIIGGGSG